MDPDRTKNAFGTTLAQTNLRVCSNFAGSVICFLYVQLLNRLFFARLRLEKTSTNSVGSKGARIMSRGTSGCTRGPVNRKHGLQQKGIETIKSATPKPYFPVLGSVPRPRERNFGVIWTNMIDLDQVSAQTADSETQIKIFM